jgi:hypothetical protein
MGGSAGFDRSGALVGLVTSEAATPKRVAGVLPQTSRLLFGAGLLATFVPELKAAATETKQQTAGEIVASRRGALVPVYCGP